MKISDAIYLPILSLKPAEMAALEELYDSEKDDLLPVISLKRWTTSKSIDNSIKRVVKSFGNRVWIADLDCEFLDTLDEQISKDNSPEVFTQFKKLATSENGYKNWVDFITSNNDLIPVIQTRELDEVSLQIDHFIKANKPIVARLKMAGSNALTPQAFNKVVNIISSKNLSELIIILDYGDLSRENLLEYHKCSILVQTLHRLIPEAIFSVSGTSFPYSFGRSYKGEIPIYERQIHNKVMNDCPNIKLAYSDRGSTREHSLNGGGGTPPPRIDYPLKNDWRFIRKEINEDKGDTKEELYMQSAQEMILCDYWIDGLPAWGRQMIEKTALGDKYGITSAHRATAVRINLHLHHQLHYFAEYDDVDIEEDWED